MMLRIWEKKILLSLLRPTWVSQRISTFNLKSSWISQLTLCKKKYKHIHIVENQLVFCYISKYLKSIICPWPKLHNTSLFVKRKIFHVHFTRWMIDCGRFPFYFSWGSQSCFGGQSHLKVPIGTVEISD